MTSLRTPWFVASWAVVAALTLGVAGVASAGDKGVEIGAAAPNFTLPDSGGDNHSLADYAGKYVVLEWVNLECPFVKKHYNSKNMQELQGKYTDQDVVWLTICSSAPGTQGHLSGEKWEEAIDEKGIESSAVLLDEDGAVGHLFAAKTTPHMYIIAPNGTLIYQGAIDSIKSTDPSDITGATNYVSEALDSHMAGKDVPNPQTKPYGCSIKYKD